MSSKLVRSLQQVFIQYGLKKSNADLALYYGFVEPNSARDAHALTFSISESDPFFQDKVEIAKANGLDENAYFDVFMDRPTLQPMLQYLRLSAIQQPDAFLLEPAFKSSIWAVFELPVSRSNEEIVCGMVLDACKSALSGYHTTAEEVLT